MLTSLDLMDLYLFVKSFEKIGGIITKEIK
jgi:hypothetical protein